jgi:Fe-S-cluster containining protein
VDAYRGCVSDADLARWKSAGRGDLLARIDSLDLGRGNILHLAWIDPETREDADRCPWLLDLPEGTGHLCGIENIKPDHCRQFPRNRGHAAQTGCPGYSIPAAGPLSPDLDEKHEAPSEKGKKPWVKTCM